jgi:hypothetical protein
MQFGANDKEFQNHSQSNRSASISIPFNNNQNISAISQFNDANLDIANDYAGKAEENLTESLS